MNIVLISHPAFMNSQSMPRFARMLEQAYISRGHHVQVWSPQPIIYKIFSKSKMAKWAGYVDQYILFPIWLRKNIKLQPIDALYVFCDQALGPWVPLFQSKPHIVHVHDLLALRSALGQVPENPTVWSGRIYQRYIRNGFQQGKHFISISDNTQNDLQHFGNIKPVTSEVVYNGLNYPYKPMLSIDAINVLEKANLQAYSEGMLLHIGGGQWYKNMNGVLQLYIEYAKKSSTPLPLLCVSPTPNKKQKILLEQLPQQGKIIFIQAAESETLKAAYSIARVFIFPSLAEGFGWPIIEAQACGCPVLTTDAPPMNEIGGLSASYLPILNDKDDIQDWAKQGAEKLISLLELPEIERNKIVASGIKNASRFNADEAIEAYLKIYRQVLGKYEIETTQESKSKMSKEVSL